MPSRYPLLACRKIPEKQVSGSFLTEAAKESETLNPPTTWTTWPWWTGRHASCNIF